MGLNLFPVRAAIGLVQADGTVLMTPEFRRALADLLERVGGEINISTEDISTLLTDQAAQPLPPEIPQQFLPPPEFAQAMAEVAALRAQVEELQQLISNQQPAARTDFSDIEQMAIEPQRPVDWEHPGKIGFKTANYGAFTTLTASSTVTLSPASANVTISPTGTGTVTISPAAALTIAPTAVSTMNNVDIGTVTPKTGTFTALNNDREIRSTQAVGGAFLGMWSLSANVNSRNWALASQSIAFGQCELVISNARLGDPTAAGTVVWSATIAGLKVTAGFGCNTKAAQASVASGAALAAYAAGANGLATGAAMQALVDKVAVMDTALKANGILS